MYKYRTEGTINSLSKFCSYNYRRTPSPKHEFPPLCLYLVLYQDGTSLTVRSPLPSVGLCSEVISRYLHSLCRWFTTSFIICRFLKFSQVFLVCLLGRERPTCFPSPRRVRSVLHVWVSLHFRSCHNCRLLWWFPPILE